jgi:RNA polymerase sigma factor (sigma-70 family)
MRKIFENAWNGIFRYWHRSKRDISREVSWEVDGPERSTPDQTDNPLSRLVSREEQGILRQALANLSSEELNAVVWHYFYGQDYEQIGTRMKRSPDAARMLCHRAKDKLRELLPFSGVRHRFK